MTRRERMLALADRFGVAIFEDDCYADLLWEGAAAGHLRSR